MLQFLSSGKAIILSIILGFMLGLLSFKLGYSDLVVYTQPFAQIFIHLLKMMIVPLVFSSIFMAIIKLGSPEKLKSIGLKSMLYYFLTTALAALIGLIIVNIMNPGLGVELNSIPKVEISESLNSSLESGAENGILKSIIQVITSSIPSNPIKAFVETQILQIIFFTILLALPSLYFRKEAAPLIAVVETIEFLSLKIIFGIMLIAPLGIFALLFEVMAQNGLDIFLLLGKYILTVIIGLFIHFTLLSFFGGYILKISPFRLVQKLSKPILTAFSTASSAATLPITMKTVEEDLNIHPETAKFVLPLGATINMDGTALYESVAVIFIGQIYGLDLSITNQIIIFVTASIAAIGAAAIPQAGIVTMGIVLSAVGFPLDAIGLILSVDRLVDMFRTSVNVFGDCIGSVFVDKFGQTT